MQKWRLRIFASIIEDLFYKSKENAISAMTEIIRAAAENMKQKQNSQAYRDIQTFTDDFETIICFDITSSKGYKIDKWDSSVEDIRKLQTKYYQLENQILQEKLDGDNSWKKGDSDDE